MIMGSLTSKVRNKPKFIQKMFYDSIPFKYRYGKVFRDKYKEIKWFHSLDSTKKETYQNKLFRNLITHSYENVPYYNKIMKKLDLTPNDFETIHDISKLPILTKDIIKDNLEDMIAQNMLACKRVEFRTSGSTGDKLIFYGTDDLYKMEAAFVLDAFEQHGATMYDKSSVWLRRYVPKTESDPLWKYDYELKRLYMSAYHLNNKTVHEYVDCINSKKYHTLVGYPSSIYNLACLCEEEGLNLNKIKSIHTASEMTLPQWADKIESVFGIRPKSHYGQQEKVSFLYQTYQNDLYYENKLYGVTEYVTKDKIIVGTGFNNYYMPFIRYQTNDTANIKDNSVVEQINGRCDDIIISDNGSRLPGVNFYTMMYKIDGVKMFQIIQKKDKSINFYLVPNNKYSEGTKKEVINGLRSRIGNLNINIIHCDEIKRSKKTGKIRCIYNEI